MLDMLGRWMYVSVLCQQLFSQVGMEPILSVCLLLRGVDMSHSRTHATGIMPRTLLPQQFLYMLSNNTFYCSTTPLLS